MKTIKILLWGLLSYMTSAHVDIVEFTPNYEKCWVFTHLVKSGGSTIKKMIKNNFSYRSKEYNSYQYKKGKNFLENFTYKFMVLKRWDIILGSYAPALLGSDYVEEKCQHFTVFRHPISRMVSAYYYCKKVSEDQLCASHIMNANDIDLITFAKHWGNYALRQFALNFVPIENILEYSESESAKEIIYPVTMNDVPGWYMFKMYLEELEKKDNHTDIPDAFLYDLIQPVQDLLRDRYTVGILEEFNTTLSLFDKAIAMDLEWHKEYNNIGTQNSDDKFKDEEAESLKDAWTNSEIKKYLYLDLVLYEHAVDVFHNQVKEYDVK